MKLGEKEAANSIKKERKSSARLRLALLVLLLSIFIKENESILYLFVSKIATHLSGNSSIRVDTIPGNTIPNQILIMEVRRKT